MDKLCLVLMYFLKFEEVLCFFFVNLFYKILMIMFDEF